MLASIPASMLNQNPPDLGIPNRIDLKTSRFSYRKLQHQSDGQASLSRGMTLTVADRARAPIMALR